MVRFDRQWIRESVLDDAHSHLMHLEDVSINGVTNLHLDLTT